MENVKKYVINDETDKAYFVAIPYWVPTNESKKKHKSMTYECWVPKSILKEEGIPFWFLTKSLQEVELRRPYKHQCNPLAEYRSKNLGYHAPEKTKIATIVIDYDKLQKLRADLMQKYGVTNYDQGFFINPKDNITDDVEKLANIYRRGSIKDAEIPKKTVYIYK